MSARAFPSIATLFPLVLASSLAALTYWLELTSRPPSSGKDGQSRHDPDYIVRSFEFRRYDEQGVLLHTLRADEMRHYPDDDSTEVKSPRIVYHREPITHIEARTAHIDSNGDRVALAGAVRFVRAGDAEKPSTEMTTERLDVWPDEELVRTSDPVAIRQGLSRVVGSGLNADNKTAILNLEGPIEGVFYRAENNRPDVSVPAPPRATRSTRPKRSSK
jgi:lipopolysaccharide export system protein LptC